MMRFVHMTPGKLIAGKYRLMRRIGDGSMGVVWAAMNEDTSREVALKLILRPGDELRLRLLREGRACGKLEHRNIVNVYDVGQTEDGDPFLVMQILKGETLSMHLKRRGGRIDPRSATKIARDVARALAVAHRANIIHRDLKPANIFLHQQEDGEEGIIVKVLDFGVSKDLGDLEGPRTATGYAVGSPAYMSPEQVRASRAIDGRTDIWSLGVVLFEMIVGARPFRGNAIQIASQIITTEAPLMSRFVGDVDPGLAEIVSRCLIRDLGKRIASASELASELHRHAVPGSEPSIDKPVPDLAPPPARYHVQAVAAGLDMQDAVTLQRAAGGSAAPPSLASDSARKTTTTRLVSNPEDPDDSDAPTARMDAGQLRKIAGLRTQPLDRRFSAPEPIIRNVLAARVADQRRPDGDARTAPQGAELASAPVAPNRTLLMIPMEARRAAIAARGVEAPSSRPLPVNSSLTPLEFRFVRDAARRRTMVIATLGGFAVLLVVLLLARLFA